MNESQANSYCFLTNLNRSELETGYHAIQKENFQLRQALQRQFNETNRLRSLLIEVLSLVNCRKLLEPSTPIKEKEKGLQLYAQLLNEKVSVLTHQLLNHSRFHTEVHKCYKGTSANINSASASPSTRRPIRGNVNELFNLKNASDNLNFNPDQSQKELSSWVQNETFDNKNVFEEGLHSEVNKVADNIDIIRLKMLIKRLSVQNATLSHHVASVDKESFALRKELDDLYVELEEVSKQITKEKEKYSSAQSLIIELSSLRQKNKILLEEIREMQEEREALKGANEKLLEELNVVSDKVK